VNEAALPETVLGLDPGSCKSGYAVVRRDGVLLEHGVVPTSEIGAVARRASGTYGVAQIVLGDGTGHKAVAEALRQQAPGVVVKVVSERDSTLQAREVYFAHHPPRGWQRLLPRGLRVPRQPYDDYVALVLARRFFAESSPKP
jgi:RNase H-fold protein (predicted Holliday junction resolvase)